MERAVDRPILCRRVVISAGLASRGMKAGRLGAGSAMVGSLSVCSVSGDGEDGGDGMRV